MIKDELKKEAEESFEKYRVTDIDYVVSPYSEDEGEKKLMFNNEYDAEEEYFRLYSKGYLASAEPREKRIAELEKENAELRKVAEFQQSSNMSRYFENKKLKEGLAVGETFNKALNSMNKSLEEERDKYRDMVFDLQEENAGLKEKYVKNITDCDICDTYCNSQLTKAKDHIKKLLDCLKQDTNDPQTNYYVCQYMDKAEQFLKDSEVEK